MKKSLKEIELLLSKCTYEEFNGLKKELSVDERRSVHMLIQKCERRFQKYFDKLSEYRARRNFENKLIEKGIKYIAGLDEVGRGPLAGPVYAAAVILNPDIDIIDIKDSKKLSHIQREEISERIKKESIGYSIGIATVEEIDKFNILNATKLAMKRAVEGLSIRPEHLLVDALKLDEVEIPQTAIIKGDDLSVSIGAASIIAKVARDGLMDEMAARFPQYGFDKNKGYGTEEHISALKNFGCTEIHRRTFLKNIL